MTLLLKEGFSLAEIKNVKLGNSQVDKIYSGSDLIFEAKPIDTTPPITTVYQSGQQVWLEVNEACDTYFTLDGSTPTTASTKFTEVLTLAETTDIKYFSVDLVGNVETVKTTTVTIVSAPTTTISPSETIQNNIPITVTLTTDEIGAAIKYRIGSNVTVFDYTAPFQVNQTTAGVLSTNITVTFWAVGANATEAEKSITYDTANAVPIAPVVTATPSETEIALSWDATANTTSYTVYRSTVNGTLGTVLAGTQWMTGTSWTDATVETGTTYYYTVQAGNYGRATNSAQVAAMRIPIPLSVDNLVAWYDAGDIEQADGATINYWADKSGNNRHGTSATTYMPTFRTNQINGLPALHFDWGGQTINAITSDWGVVFPQPLTIIFVGNYEGYLDSLQFFYDGRSFEDRQQMYITLEEKNLHLKATTPILSSYQPSPSYFIAIGEHNLNNSTMRINNQIVANGDIGTGGLGGISIGSEIIGANGIRGNIAEFLIYSKALSSEERSKIESYLSEKYNIALLDNTYRYVRYQGYGDQTNAATTRLVELQAMEGATNRLLGKVPISGEAVSSGGTIDKATDGSLSMASGAYPLWWMGAGIPTLTYDLGAAYPIDTLKLWMYSVDVDPRQTKFKLFVSKDNVNWTTVIDMSANTTVQPANGWAYTL
jgi:hypothetical protein